MIPIAISVAVVAWAVIASLLALRNGAKLRQAKAEHAQRVEDLIQMQETMRKSFLNVTDCQITWQHLELVKLRKAAQKRGANGQYIKK